MCTTATAAWIFFWLCVLWAKSRKKDSVACSAISRPARRGSSVREAEVILLQQAAGSYKYCSGSKEIL